MNARHTHRPARALAGLLAFSATLAVTASALAARTDVIHTRPSRGHVTADGSLVDVQVQVDGQTAPLYFRPGTSDRHYFQAFTGRNYSLVVHNTTGRRVGVLLAVDGLNVVNGELSRLDHNEPMYVLDPYETSTIRGWRTSLDEVRRFVFVDEQRSYAERTGQANGDLGWIRVLAFAESRPWIDVRRFRDELGGNRSGREENLVPERGAPAPVARDGAKSAKPETQSFQGGRQDGPAADANPGTGWGDRSHDPVNSVDFQAARTPSDQLVLRYEYAAGLAELGIDVRGSRLWDRESGQLGFARPPRW
jgi:hypothetical protein